MFSCRYFYLSFVLLMSRRARHSLSLCPTTQIFLVDGSQLFSFYYSQSQIFGFVSNFRLSLNLLFLVQFVVFLQNDKQRRIEYVQQIQKLRKEQRYYSMWDLPPLLEVEADGTSTDQCDGSVSPSVSSSPDPSWNEVSPPCFDDDERVINLDIGPPTALAQVKSNHFR